MTADAPEPKPKQNVKFMLKWCRKNIPGFADMQDRALAAKEPKK